MKRGRPGTHGFDVIFGNETLGFILLVGSSLSLGLPPAVVVVLVKEVQQISLSDGQLALGRGRIVVNRPVYAQESHIDADDNERRVIVGAGGLPGQRRGW